MASSTVKKVFQWIAIILAIVVFLFIALVTTMMLAPGLDVFGVRYVSAKVGKYKEEKTHLTIGGDLNLSTGSVPVTITFGESGSGGVVYEQQFQGFSKSSDTPSLSVLNQNGEEYSSGKCFIKTTEYKKFIWANRLAEFYLNINLPVTYLATNSFNIESENSDITIVGHEGLAQSIKNLSVKTGGTVTIKNKLNITENLTVDCANSLYLDSNVNVGGNIVANMHNESLKIDNPIGGDINFTSTGGTLTFNTCKNLTTNTSSGNVYTTGTGLVSGNLNIETKYGAVEIKTITGTENNIKAHSGIIKIDNVAGLLNIESTRSDITIGNAVNLNLKTTTGDIKVTGAITGNITAESSANGDIICNAIQGDASLKTKNGNITISGAVVGNLYIESVEGKTQFVSCNNLSGKVGNRGIYTSADTSVVAGSLDITSDWGEINIKKVNGANNKINTKHGDVNIETIEGNLVIGEEFDRAYQAKINIGTVGTLNVDASYCEVYVKNVNSATIATNARVELGTNGTVGSANVTSFDNELIIRNATGEIKANSNAMVKLYDCTSDTVFINCHYNGAVLKNDYNGGIETNNIQGTIHAYSSSNKNINMNFNTLSGNVYINTGNNCRKVTVTVNGVDPNDINYELNSANEECKVYRNQTEILHGKNLTGTNASYPNKIKVSTYEQLELYCIKSA